MYTQYLERIPAGEGLVQLKGPCFVTGQDHVTPPIPIAALEAYEAGAYAQVAFPMLSAEEREFIISGTSPEGWRQTFGPLEEER